MSVKKLLAGEGDWECVKEVLGWIIYTEAGTVALPERKLQELRDLLEIPTTQWRMVKDNLERSVGKLLCMHLAVTGRLHISTTFNVRWPRWGQIGPGCLQTSTVRSRTGECW